MTHQAFLDDVTEIALAAYDDAYTAEYLAFGATDNKAVAMRSAVESVLALCAMDCEASRNTHVDQGAAMTSPAARTAIS